MAYTYKLYKSNLNKKSLYTQYELEHMSTFQLQEICKNEKIITRNVKENKTDLKRDELIQLVLRYRGIPTIYLQEKPDDIGWEILQEKVRKRFKTAQKLKIPKKLEATVEAGIHRKDSYLVEHEYENGVLMGLILQDDKICALLEVENNIVTLDKHRIWLEPGTYRNLTFVLLDPISSFFFAEFYNYGSQEAAKSNLSGTEVCLPQFVIKNLEKTQDTLFVNIGSSNICIAGEINDNQKDIKYIPFRKGCKVCNHCQQCMMCPSMAVVLNCKTTPKFLFAYEAMEYMRLGGFSHSMSIFRNMKKLFQHVYEQKEVYDCHGNHCIIEISELIRTFFIYLVETAEAFIGKQYRTIELVAEVGFEKSMQDVMQKLLPQFNIKTNYTTSLSAAFWDISEQTLRNYKKQDTLVYHIGGETAALTSVQYNIVNKGFTFHLQAKLNRLKYENLFGGECITYRIMQYIKILLCKDVEQIERLTQKFQEALTMIDRYPDKRSVYSEFVDMYQACEKYIPTKFEENRGEKIRARQNFFRLWYLAEGCKRYFYESNKGYLSIEELFPEYSFFHFYESNEWKEYRVHLGISLREIEYVILGDFYNLAKQFIEPICDEDGILSGVSIKFSGQCCLADACRTSLSEFTVGRMRRLDSIVQGGLKFRSISGAIMLDYLKKSGILTHTITQEIEKSSYQLRYCHYDSREEVISFHGETVYGFVSRHSKTKVLIVGIFDDKNILKREFEIKINEEEFTVSGYQKLFNEYSFFIEVQSDLDAMKEDEIRIFFFKSKLADFAMMPLARKNNEIYAGNMVHYYFEEGIENFFDGMH